MNEKDNNQTPSFNDPLNWKALGFFSAEDYLIYIFKKTEKITAALYLVSSLLKDEEPIKWELRDKGMDLLSSSFTASSAVPGDKNAVIQSIFTAALETMSLLNVAHISHLISDMNHKILVREIDQVVTLLKERLTTSAENAGYVLSEQFFKTPDLFSTGFSIGQDSSIKDNQNRQVKSIKDKGVSQGQVMVQQKKSQRQEHIINVLKGQGNLTIKDFSKVIKDCSEKTIQRELLELVEKGIIRKEGERRWSRYSLK
ncbi:MAG: DeoR family transcriptional regulator [Patescibacteria group bacterium]